MENNNGNKFEDFCVVELFGHQQIAGKVTEQAIGGATFIRVDVPKTSKRDAFTKFYGPGAIYAITPVEEKTVQAMAEALEIEPVAHWRLRSIEPERLLEADEQTPYRLPTPGGTWSLFGPDNDPYDEADAVRDIAAAIEDILPDEDEEDDELDDRSNHAFDKRAAAIWARRMLEEGFVIIDTETTGFGETDEIIQIGIVDHTGAVIMDQFVRPQQPIKNSQYHGITDETVMNAPTFPEVYEAIKAAVAGRWCLAYNWEFDSRMLDQVAVRRHGLAPFGWERSGCVMEQYAMFYGEWNDYRGNYRWQGLQNALTFEGLSFDGQKHNAVVDCQATLALIRKMAAWEQPNIPF